MVALTCDDSARQRCQAAMLPPPSNETTMNCGGSPPVAAVVPLAPGAASVNPANSDPASVNRPPMRNLPGILRIWAP